MFLFLCEVRLLFKSLCSCIGFKKNLVLAVGDDAKRMIGRTPATLLLFVHFGMG